MTVTTHTPNPATSRTTKPATAVWASHITSAAGDATTLHDTSFTIARGEVVGIAGGSGAGKTTLLETIAGIRPPTSGEVVRRGGSAFVPQDDIIHLDMPLRRTLLHAASLRIAGLNAIERATAVDRVLRRLDLVDQSDVRVGDLSGGQRKRASMAAEMLTDPELFFLDEPTSGLDPANAARLMHSLRDLAAAGSTIVVSTHSTADLARCDRICFIGRGGHVMFVGTSSEAKVFFAVEELSDVYAQLDQPDLDRVHIDRLPVNENRPPVGTSGDTDVPVTTGAGRQLLGLVCRNVDLIRSNRLTLGILVGSPIFIISMMTTLFPTGAFDIGTGSIALGIQTLFWLAFNSFFFGLTYGLLQVVGEFEIVRRERRFGLRVSAYITSKFAVLAPMLAFVNFAQILAMESVGRLPDLSGGDRAGMFISLQLLSLAAVAVGLHASSAVQNPAQATLALPMLCFPQVLFAGAVVPVATMGWFAEAMSTTLAVRWAFEPLGRILDLGPAAANEAATAGFEDAFTGSPAQGWAIMCLVTAVGAAGAIRTLRRRTAPGATR